MCQTTAGIFLAVLKRLGTVAACAFVSATAAGHSAEVEHSSPANRLQYETSPYLLLHAHNPVNWYPWGQEAIARARAEDKPIFLSVGYSTCYWCHVMERKVFADSSIAAMMNEWFINIKVDREERPDLDQIYMTATQILSGKGGWPNSVFLTTDLMPFYAGTYFPPEDSYGRPGFPRVLEALNAAWENERSKVEDAAAQITDAIRRAQQEQGDSEVMPDSTLLARTAVEMMARYDGVNGGFGGAPKFPPAMRLDFLLEEGSDEALRAVTHTLSSMADGGMYDQVGGGFHRYSTDVRWHVPHFEKMLYNQAQLVRTYATAYTITGGERWKRVAEDALRYVAREMTSEKGGFYSALDAETDAVEGKYYVWNEADIIDLLGADAALFLDLYGMAPVPEVEGSVIFRKTTESKVAADHGIDVSLLRSTMVAARSILLAERQRRPYPLKDDKILTSWNGMMIGACAEAYAAFGEPSYLRAAEAAALFIEDHLRTASGGLQRVYHNGTVKQEGFLEDYAHYADGLLAIYRATGQKRWLDLAEDVVDETVSRFWDETGAGYFYTEGTGDDLIARSKSASDSALPSPNAVAVKNMLVVARETERGDLFDRAGRALRLFGSSMVSHPSGYTSMASAARAYLKDGAPTVLAPAAIEARLQVGLVSASQVVQVSVEPPTLLLRPGEPTSLAVNLQIEETWHVNTNLPTSKWLIPTTVTMNADLPVELTEIGYPKGEYLFFPSFEDTLEVYEGQVAINASLVTGAGAQSEQEGELQLLVSYQACDDSRCLPPAEIVEVVPVRVSQGEH